MATWLNKLRNLAVATGFAGLLGLTSTGCGKSSAPDHQQEGGPSVAGPENPNAVENPGLDPEQSATVNFNQSFEEAANTEVLEGHHLPPDVTFGGKKTGPLRAALEESWSKIKLTDALGRPVPYVLHLETSEGAIEIQLRPEFAPNHVRNILALARAGFYNGLQFERIIHQEAELDGQKSRLDMLIAGCPMGTGDDGFGHIGYFMHSEFRQNLKHSEGAVGFWHEEDPDSAGCRFYITLGPAPILDGKFTIIGSVIKGLPVVRKIASQPVQSPDMSPENEKPVNPTLIKKATITPEPMEKTEPVNQNERNGN
jgi:cyclophilin family peptidyl-prolyl cis-trans isomerase